MKSLRESRSPLAVLLYEGLLGLLDLRQGGPRDPRAVTREENC